MINLGRVACIVVLAACALGGSAGAQSTTPSGIRTMKMDHGTMITDGRDMTLYVYDGDSPGKSACNGTCAQNWPPFLAPADAKLAGAFTLVTREDGTKQWAYKGKPLYHWKNDKAPMDMNGDGVGGKWHVADL
jgi:predicted lipoprotein with Yx(FWY)xxD motif